MKLIRIVKKPRVYFNKAYVKMRQLYRAIAYKGNNVICEICGWKGKTFFDQKCPKCNSLPRTRLVPFSLQYFNLHNDNPKILHIAPNINEFNYIKSKITPILNYDRLNIREVPHINLVQDLTKTDLEDNLYDVVLAWHVLEHILEDKKAINEAYRILKPNGSFLISVPIYPIGNKITYEDSKIPYSDYERVHGHYDHCRSCGLDYYKRFEKYGFKTKTLAVKNLNQDKIDNFGLRPDHVVWCFTK